MSIARARVVQQKQQKQFVKVLNHRSEQGLVRRLEGMGHIGHTLLAQLHSQSGRSAMSWVGSPRSQSMPTLHTAAMVLTGLGIQPFGLEGDACVFCKATSKSREAAKPTTAHMLSCSAQHLYGPDAEKML